MFAKLWKFFKKTFHKMYSFFKKKPEKPIIPDKMSRLETSLKSYKDEMENLQSLREFYKNDYFNNEENIKEIDKKINIIRQEMFAKNRELRREKSKQNLKKLKGELEDD